MMTTYKLRLLSLCVRRSSLLSLTLGRLVMVAVVVVVEGAEKDLGFWIASLTAATAVGE